MTMILPHHYHARRALEETRVVCIAPEDAERQDIRPLRIGTLNVMPKAESYEFSLLQPLGRSIVQIEPVWIRLESHSYSSSNREHIRSLYVTFEEALHHRTLDGLALTGAPVKEIPYEEVRCRRARPSRRPQRERGRDTPGQGDFPMRIHDNVLGLIGHTPLIRQSKLTRDLPVTQLGKLESLNPGGSVKDRIGLALVEDAERRSLLRPGGTIIEATAGNTGVGLALVAAIKGYRCVFVMPDKMSEDKVNLLRAYGAEVVITPTSVPPDSPESYSGVADRLGREIPGAYRPQQFANPANPDTHYRPRRPPCLIAIERRALAPSQSTLVKRRSRRPEQS